LVDHDLLPLLDQRLRGKFSPVLADTSATILLTAGGVWNWTVVIDRGRITARRGAPSRPTTTVRASVEVLSDVVSGRRSGVEAFLDGQLVVRGNLALSLQLDGLFVGSEPADHLTRTRLIVAAGVETFFLEAGPPDAQPVILVHGLGATNASMLPLLVDLGRTYRVLAPDLPGHGASGAGRYNYGAKFLGNWLSAFITETCGDTPAILVGNSLGGRTALEAAMIDPAPIRGLVLLCPAVAFRRLRQFVPLVRVVRPELAALKVRVPRVLVVRGLRALFADPSRLPDVWYQAAVDEFERVIGTRRGRIAFFSALRQIYLDEPFGEAGFWQRLAAMKPPAMFVWGDRDVLVPAAFARHVQQALPSARTVVLPDCGHVPQFEYRTRTAELVEEFIAGIDLPNVSRRRQARKRTGR
jgi:pimeloyl-ACP methyl ester carboxylesterase/putative sterol carrier protein